MNRVTRRSRKDALLRGIVRKAEALGGAANGCYVPGHRLCAVNVRPAMIEPRVRGTELQIDVDLEPERYSIAIIANGDGFHTYMPRLFTELDRETVDGILEAYLDGTAARFQGRGLLDKARRLRTRVKQLTHRVRHWRHRALEAEAYAKDLERKLYGARFQVSALRTVVSHRIYAEPPAKLTHCEIVDALDRLLATNLRKVRQ